MYKFGLKKPNTKSIKLNIRNKVIELELGFVGDNLVIVMLRNSSK